MLYFVAAARSFGLFWVLLVILIALLTSVPFILLALLLSSSPLDRNHLDPTPPPSRSHRIESDVT